MRDRDRLTRQPLNDVSLPLHHLILSECVARMAQSRISSLVQATMGAGMRVQWEVALERVEETRVAAIGHRLGCRVEVEDMLADTGEQREYDRGP